MKMEILSKMISKSAIILLSGGLDSLVALGYSKEVLNIDIKLALTFDYGQKSVKSEIDASEKICKYYNVKHKVISLDWLKEITKTALVSEENVPQTNFQTKKSALAVWVPNRNALFLNIAACFCDSFKIDYIIYGANKDEAETFPDNTELFRKEVSKLFQTSTMHAPTVLAPLINYSKDDIVKIAVENSMPLELTRSCYNSGEKNCGKCESCYHLKKALIANHCEKYINELFEENEN